MHKCFIIHTFQLNHVIPSMNIMHVFVWQCRSFEVPFSYPVTHPGDMYLVVMWRAVYGWSLYIAARTSYRQLLVKKKQQTRRHHSMIADLVVLCEGNPNIIGVFPSQRTNDAKLCSFPDETVMEQTIELSVIWDAMTPIKRHCNEVARMLQRG